MLYLNIRKGRKRQRIHTVELNARSRFPLERLANLTLTIIQENAPLFAQKTYERVNPFGLTLLAMVALTYVL